ncbi:MAG: glycosyltransferase family 4 protein [Anaerolineales bacterium]|nr:glycosyltransferase family 4 protein [Anaerolineales bacterium]
MHILLIHQAFAAINEPGGTRHHEFARQLTRRGHRVTVITSQVSYLTGRTVGDGGWLTREVDDVGVEILRCRSYSGWHRSFLHRMLSFLSFMAVSFWTGLRVADIDLVWGTTPPIFQAVTARWIAGLKRLPFLLEVRDLWPSIAVAVGVLTNPLLIRLSEWLERGLYRRADRVVVNSPGFVEHVRSRGAKQVDVVPNGVDLDMFDEEKKDQSLRRELGLAEGFLVIYAGAHGMSNDLETALRAAELLQNEEDIQFVFLGDGKEKSNLMALAESMALRNLHFLPSIPKDQIASTLVQADAGLAILLAVDAYKTTYPNKVFDYMAAGLPVILAIDGVVRQVVEGTGAGLFAQPGDPEAIAEVVRRLAADPILVDQLGQAGRRCVEGGFDREHLAAKMAVIMEKMAANGKGHSTDGAEAEIKSGGADDG